MHTIEAGPLYMLTVFFATIFCFRLIDWLDGASKWERQQVEASRKAEADGWASIKGN